MKQYWNKEFLLSNKKNIIKATAIVCLAAAAFFVFVLNGEEPAQEPPVVQTEEETLANSGAGETNGAEERTGGPIVVDVGGAVKTPQVVELEDNSRVADAISAAGGLKDNADTAGINQAAFLTDGEKVYVPVKGENGSAAALGAGQVSQIGQAGPGTDAGGKVNINTATSEELQTLNGVGPATAEKILDYRAANGAFKTIEDLKNVSGIGDKTFEKLKEHIVV